MKARILTLGCFLVVCAFAHADVLKLKAGGKVEGDIVSETDTEYVVNTKLGSIRVKKENVESVQKGKVDRSDRLKSQLKGVLSLLKNKNFVRARKAWDELKKVPSPAWDEPQAQTLLLAQLEWLPPEGVARTFDGLLGLLDEMTRDLCFTCEAEGTQDCSTCKGAGRAPCTTCAGKPRHCTMCNGSGGVLCTHCNGKGTITCQSCSSSKRKGFVVTEERVRTAHTSPTGKVWYSDDIKTTVTPCGGCGGDPTWSCETCTQPGSGPGRLGRPQPGKAKCTSCEGMGRLACEAGCEAGLSTSPCTDCQGSGKRPCGRCAGTGRKDVPPEPQ